MTFWGKPGKQQTNDIMERYWWTTNKRLTRGFSSRIEYKKPDFGNEQFSSLFDSELRTPSLVFAIICGLAFEVKLSDANIT